MFLWMCVPGMIHQVSGVCRLFTLQRRRPLKENCFIHKARQPQRRQSKWKPALRETSGEPHAERRKNNVRKKKKYTFRNRYGK